MGSSDVVIRVEGLGKKYTLQHEQPQRHNTLRDLWAEQAGNLARWANPFTLPGQLRRSGREAALDKCRAKEDFWALKDVSFEIRRGERVGIIGRNGAGKSTLLKILSRITEPTTGRVELRGRVASLLEVGTGFHPELTGRENIYLNGAILGMTRSEIRSKFDEIVAFAEVEKFLDSPVKRYSSGMYVRLAFAVAAHLEPEILVVDEVLAVGDASFQKKCLGKMEDVAEQEGRTVLFVSHQMNAVTRLCNRCLVIISGTISLDSRDTKKAVNEYLFADNTDLKSTWTNKRGAYQSREVIPAKLEIRAETVSDGTFSSSFENNTSLLVSAIFAARDIDESMNVGIALYSQSGELLLWSFTSDCDQRYWPRLVEGLNTLQLKIPSHYLNEGTYRIEFLASYHMRKFIISPGEGPQISFSIRGGLSPSPHWLQARPGVMAPLWRWHSQEACRISDVSYHPDFIY